MCRPLRPLRSLVTGLGLVLAMTATPVGYANAESNPDLVATELASDWLVRFTSLEIPEQLENWVGNVSRQLGIDVVWSPVRLSGTIRLQLSEPVVGAQLIQILEPLADLAIVQPNRRWHVARVPDDPEFGKQWGLRNNGQTLNTPQDPADPGRSACDANDDGFCELDPGEPGVDTRADVAWDTTTGDRQVRVAVIDTGGDVLHPDLVPNLYVNGDEVPNDGLDNDNNGYIDDVNGWDACDNDGDPNDAVGHGTQVAGVIGASGNDGYGIAGVAWDVSIIHIRFLGAFPTLTGSDCGLTNAAVAALDYALAADADVVNMSWGGPEEDSIIKAKLDELAAADIVLVAAAGNSGADMEDSPFFPAAHDMPQLLSVAAHTNDNGLASFSNFGGSVNIAAPGMSVRTDVVPFIDLWDEANFDDTTESGPISSGRVDGTDFTAGGSNITWGVAESILGDIAIVGDFGTLFAVQQFGQTSPSGHENGINQTLESDAIDLASWGNGILTYAVTHDLGTGSELRLEYRVGGVGNWTLAPDGKYSGLGVAEPYYDFEAILGFLPSDLQIRFVMTTGGDHDSDLFAGGVAIQGVRWIKQGDDYSSAFGFIQGTSFAAPYVAGAAALVRGVYPQLSAADVVRQLTDRGELLAVETSGTSGVIGDRRLDIAGALDVDPILTWVGDDGFASDGLEPDNPGPSEPVTFRSLLFDPEGQVGSILGAALVIRDPFGDIAHYGLDQIAALDTQMYTVQVTFPVAGEYLYRFAVTADSGELPGDPSGFSEFRVGTPGQFIGGGGGSDATTDPTVPQLPSGGCGCNVSAGGATNALPGLLFCMIIAAGIFLRLRGTARIV